MQQKQFKVNDFVFVNSDRGITPGIARITSVSSNEAKIDYDNGEKGEYYFVHLHQTPECFNRRKQFLIDRANKVGKK